MTNIDRFPYFYPYLKAYFSYQLANMDTFDQSYKHPAINSVKVFLSWQKLTNNLLILQVKINKIASWTDDVLRRGNKRFLNFVKQVFFLLSTEGSLVDNRASLALYLGGTPSQRTGTSPPSCLLFDNRLYINGSWSHLIVV